MFIVKLVDTPDRLVDGEVKKKSVILNMLQLNFTHNYIK